MSYRIQYMEADSDQLNSQNFLRTTTTGFIQFLVSGSKFALETQDLSRILGGAISMRNIEWRSIERRLACTAWDWHGKLAAIANERRYLYQKNLRISRLSKRARQIKEKWLHAWWHIVNQDVIQCQQSAHFSHGLGTYSHSIKMRTTKYCNTVELRGYTFQALWFWGFIDMQSSGLSRQDTLPAEDPLWSYSRVPGQPAPIPPRNEPLLYISNVVNDFNMHATASCLKNLRLRVHLPPHMATMSESILYDKRTVGTTQANICIENQDCDLRKDSMTPQVCMIDSGLLSSFCANPVSNQRLHFGQTRLFTWTTWMMPAHCRQWFRWPSMILHHKHLVSVPFHTQEVELIIILQVFLLVLVQCRPNSMQPSSQKRWIANYTSQMLWTKSCSRMTISDDDLCIRDRDYLVEPSHVHLALDQHPTGVFWPTL